MKLLCFSHSFFAIIWWWMRWEVSGGGVVGSWRSILIDHIAIESAFCCHQLRFWVKPFHSTIITVRCVVSDHSCRHSLFLLFLSCFSLSHFYFDTIYCDDDVVSGRQHSQYYATVHCLVRSLNTLCGCTFLGNSLSLLFPNRSISCSCRVGSP